MESSAASTHGNFARWLVRWFVRGYYGRIEITGGERIARTGPVLLCANHPNSLIDPVMVGLASRRPVRFLAKAPLFSAPVLGPILQALGMVPAFRGSDDPGQVRQNLESIDVAARILADGHALGIFPEGKSHDAPTVEMIRSGTARIAVKALELGAGGLSLVPVGINYESKERFRSRVWVCVGEPLDVAAWLAGHGGQTKPAMRALTGELDKRLKEVVVHLDEPRWEEWLDDLETLAPPWTPAAASEASPREASAAPVAPAVPRGVEPLRRRKRIADAINHFLAADRPRAEAVAKQIEDHRNEVRNAGLRVDSSALHLRGPRLFGSLLGQYMLLLVLAVPALLATLHHLVPFLIVRELAARFRSSGSTMIATGRLFLGIPIYGLWYGLVAWWMFGYFAAWFAWTWLLAMPAAGLVAVMFWHQAGEALAQWWHQCRGLVRPGRLRHLRAQRAALQQALQEMARAYAAVAGASDRPVRPSRLRALGRAGLWGLLAAAVFLACWFARPWLVDQPLAEATGGPDLASEAPDRLRARLDADEAALTALLAGLDDLETQALALRADFEAGRRSLQNDADGDALRRLLVTYVSYRSALLRLLWYYQRHADIEQRPLGLRAFLVGVTAASALHEASLKLVAHFDHSRDTVATLNVGAPAWGIPPRLYDTVKRNLASAGNQRLLEAARAYHGRLDDAYAAAGLRDAPPHATFHAAVRRAEATAQRLGGPLWQRRIELAAEDLVRLARTVHYETQSAIATWIGDVKLREPRGRSLIEPARVAELRPQLRPGDILLERRNWYLSNAFLPGYWPHAAVYVGTPDDLASLGLDQDERVRRHWPKFVEPDAEGHRRVVIEAISEGVVLTSLEHSIGGGDSAAVLRPRVADAERKEAVARAFNQVGKPYDFNFDFDTPGQLVCTEVVYRSYGANAGTLRFPLQSILGRQAMPAVDLVAKYRQECGQPDRQLDLVAFLDGDETAGTCRFCDEPDFLATVDRPALTTLQSSPAGFLMGVGPVGWGLLGLTGLSLLGVAVSRGLGRLRQKSWRSGSAWRRRSRTTETEVR